MGNVDAAKSGIDNIFGFIDAIKAVVNNIQKGQPYEGLGGRPYVATPMRDQEGDMTGFSPVPQRSAAGPGRGPLFLGVGRSGQERYDTMKRNRDKFAGQLEDPDFLELAKKDPKGYAARILAQKQALDANLQELEEVYGFGARAADKANEAKDKAKAAAETEIKPGTETVQKDPALASALAKNMGFDWDPTDKMGIKDLIAFLKNTCLSVQFCDKAAGSTTPEAPRTSYDEGVIEGPDGPMIPSEGTDGTVYTPLPPAYGPDPYPPNLSPDDNYENGNEVTPPKFLGGQSVIGTPFSGKAPGDEASGNVENIISKLEGIGSLISDETVNKLTAFGNIFSQGVAAFDGYIGRLESVAQSLPTEIVMTLQTPRVEVIVNMNNATNRITQVVESVIQAEIGDKFQEMSQRITSLENKNNPLGNDSSATYPNNP